MSTRPDKYHPKARKAREQAKTTMLSSLLEPVLNCDPNHLKQLANYHSNITDTGDYQDKENKAVAELIRRAMRIVSMSYSLSNNEAAKLWWPDEASNEEKSA